MKNTIRATLAILSLASGLLVGCDVPPDQTTTPDQTTAATEALVNNGGGTGSNSWWCGEDGLCTCEGGTLSSDCWGLSQYCIDGFQCRVSPPYLCYCHWKAVRQTPGVKATRAVGSVSITNAFQ